MSRNFTRSFTTVVAGPIIAAGVLAGSMVVGAATEAGAQPTSGTKCSTLTMPGTGAEVSPDTLNPLTRAAQVAAVNPTPQAPVFDISC